MNKIDFFKRGYRGQDELIRNVVVKQWDEMDVSYSKRIEEVLATLQQYHAKCVWEGGYKPKKSHFISEKHNYGLTEGIGISSECEKSETFHQKVYPLIEELDGVLKELKEIKSKWWYKLITMFGKR